MNGPMLASFALILQTVALSAPTTKSYHNADLHLSFEYPADFQVGNFGADIADETKKQNSAVAQAMQCVTNPLVAFKEATTSVILFIRLDLTCPKLAPSVAVLPQIAQSSMTQGLSKIGSPSLGLTSAYKLGSYDAVFIPASTLNAAGKPAFFGGISCVLVGQSVACWSAMSPEKATVANLLTNAVTFEGQSAHPVVPIDLLQK